MGNSSILCLIFFLFVCFFPHLCCPHVGREANDRKSRVDWEGSVTSGENNAILPSQIIYLLADVLLEMFLGFEMKRIFGRSPVPSFSLHPPQ